MKGKEMSETSTPESVIRTVSLEREEDGCRAVLDIREYQTPPRIEGSRSFTALSKDDIRRQLMVGLAIEVDRMLSGECSEIQILYVG